MANEKLILYRKAFTSDMTHLVKCCLHAVSSFFVLEPRFQDTSPLPFSQKLRNAPIKIIINKLIELYEASVPPAVRRDNGICGDMRSLFLLDPTL